jgi:hypothetical protein
MSSGGISDRMRWLLKNSLSEPRAKHQMKEADNISGMI